MKLFLTHEINVFSGRTTEN